MKDKNKLNAGYVLIDTWWNVNPFQNQHDK